MSTRSATKLAEEGGDERERTTCKVCAGQFVSHKHYEQLIKFPEDVCVWCATRSDGQMLRRFELMERALRRIEKKRCLKDEPDGCKCSPCLAKRAIGMMGA